MEKAINIIFVLLVGIVAFTIISKYGLGHKGAGDTVHALASTVGIKQLENCGCTARQHNWNIAIPY